MGDVVLAADEYHQCIYPHVGTPKIGTLFQCGGCGTWWYYRDEQWPFTGPEWARIRFWHRRYRRRINRRYNP